MEGKTEAALMGILEHVKAVQKQQEGLVSEVRGMQKSINTLEVKIETMEDFISRVTTSEKYTLPVCAESRMDMLKAVEAAKKEVTAETDLKLEKLENTVDERLDKLERDSSKGKISINDIITKVIYTVIALGVGALVTKLF